MYDILTLVLGLFGNKKRARKGGKRRVAPTFSTFLPSAVEGLSCSTAENYRTALRSFRRFNKGKDRCMSSVSVATVLEYERWLHDNGVSFNTSSCYLRSLRAIYNKAAERRLVGNVNPFKKAFTGNVPTVKRGMDITNVRLLQSLCLPVGSRLQLTRDLFLFSFYAMGMPFTDMAYLRKCNICDSLLVYSRRKTGKRVTVRIEPCMLHIMKRYAVAGTDYVFPILYKVKNGKTLPIDYNTALNSYNRDLKHLSKVAGIKTSLTSYVARHSWASYAYAQNVSLSVISKALGHSNPRTTLVYVNELTDDRVARENKKLLKGIFRTPLGKRCNYH